MEHLALADDGEGQGRVAIKLVLKYNKYSVPHSNPNMKYLDITDHLVDGPMRAEYCDQS